MIRINGKQVPKGLALEMLRKAAKVTALSIEFPHPAKRKGPATNEGVELSKEYLAEISDEMDRVNASYGRVEFTRCGKLANKDILIIVREGPAPKLERLLRWLNLIS